MNKILVNATAARSSGALSILNQFLESIELESENVYYIFVDNNFKKNLKKNVIYIEKNTASWLNRILWDEFQLNKWIKNSNVEFSLFISFQNTGAKIDDTIPQLIYYHQPLPLSDVKWNLYKKEERLFFLYKHFYSFFVRRHLTSKTQIVVQTKPIKDAFIHKFRFNESHIHVIKPNMNKVDYSTIEDYDFGDDYIHFLYPATPLIYKGHNDIVDALCVLKQKDPFLLSKIRVHFTFKSIERKSLYEKITKYGLADNIIFEGIIPFRKLLSYYKASHALLFASYIETLGLPLLEAAAVGIPIVVSDLPYARDVLGSYDGAIFIKPYDINEWCNGIIRICQSNMHCKNYIHQNTGGWNLFFELIDQIKNK